MNVLFFALVITSPAPPPPSPPSPSPPSPPPPSGKGGGDVTNEEILSALTDIQEDVNVILPDKCEDPRWRANNGGTGESVCECGEWEWPAEDEAQCIKLSCCQWMQLGDGGRCYSRVGANKCILGPEYDGWVPQPRSTVYFNSPAVSQFANISWDLRCFNGTSDISVTTSGKYEYTFKTYAYSVAVQQGTNCTLHMYESNGHGWGFEEWANGRLGRRIGASWQGLGAYCDWFVSFPSNFSKPFPWPLDRGQYGERLLPESWLQDLFTGKHFHKTCPFTVSFPPPAPISPPPLPPVANTNAEILVALAALNSRFDELTKRFDDLSSRVGETCGEKEKPTPSPTPRECAPDSDICGPMQTCICDANRRLPLFSTGPKCYCA